MAERKMIIDGVSCPFTTERNVPPETAAPVPTDAPKQPQATAAADAAYICLLYTSPSPRDS